jgi:hypothetical protein
MHEGRRQGLTLGFKDEKLKRMELNSSYLEVGVDF